MRPLHVAFVWHMHQLMSGNLRFPLIGALAGHASVRLAFAVWPALAPLLTFRSFGFTKLSPHTTHGDQAGKRDAAEMNSAATAASWT